MEIKSRQRFRIRFSDKISNIVDDLRPCLLFKLLFILYFTSNHNYDLIIVQRIFHLFETYTINIIILGKW